VADWLINLALFIQIAAVVAGVVLGAIVFSRRRAKPELMFLIGVCLMFAVYPLSALPALTASWLFDIGLISGQVPEAFMSIGKFIAPLSAVGIALIIIAFWFKSEEKQK
jgi:hypothetical protein